MDGCLACCPRGFVVSASHERRIVRSDPNLRHSSREWADRLAATVTVDVRARFADDPKGTVTRQLGLRIVPSAALERSRGDKGSCDGVSIIEDGVIHYALTPFSKRENFTIAHEVGHLLVDSFDPEDDMWDWLADQPDSRRLVEDTCDLVARRLLLPREQVDAVLGRERASGTAVVRLYDSSEASREVCAIAIAERLGCEGFVMLAKAGTGRVTFVSRAGRASPAPWSGDQLPMSHPLRTLEPGATQVLESWWPRRTDSDRRRYYEHATQIGGWIYAAFAENDLWGAVRLHLPEPERRRAPSRYQTCRCGWAGVAHGFPCNSCHRIPCPGCDECDCDERERMPRATCHVCFQSVLVHLLVDGLCPNCR